ncbi:MAG: FtsQ-type POTRA domain-containing protein [Thermodesulfovibrionales bacterium]
MKANKFKRTSRGLKIFSIVRKITVLISIFITATGVYFYVHTHPGISVFPLKHLTFIGNRHLTDDELRAFAGVHLNESLLMVSNKEVSQYLLKSPWVRSVSVRKEFPDTLSMTIKETEPFALLNMNEHLFLIDENGKLLEELKGDSVPFLPVIAGDPFKEKKGFSEALNFIKVMNAKRFSSERDHIEIIAHKPHELSITVDGIIVKIGTGGYEEKLDRFIRLEEDIKNMGIPVDSIDLRFENRAIVKPVTDKVVR